MFTKAAGWGSVIPYPAPSQARQAAGADDEAAGVTLHAADEDDAPLAVVGVGVLHVLPDDGVAVGAGGAEDVEDGSGHHDANRSGGNNGHSALRQPSVAGFSLDRQSWWTARPQSQHQMPPMTRVSSSCSTTRTARWEPQPQHISRNWWASGSVRNGGLACMGSAEPQPDRPGAQCLERVALSSDDVRKIATISSQISGSFSLHFHIATVQCEVRQVSRRAIRFPGVHNHNSGEISSYAVLVRSIYFHQPQHLDVTPTHAAMVPISGTAAAILVTPAPLVDRDGTAINIRGALHAR